ncbi:MAG: M1 family aminopeptidase [Polyangiaceae bacterium]
MRDDYELSRRGALLALLSAPLAACASRPPPLQGDPTIERARIDRTRVALALDPRERTFTATARLELAFERVPIPKGTARPSEEQETTFAFDALDLEIESVTSEGQRREFSVEGGKLLVDLQRTGAERPREELEIRYSGGASRGLVFAGDAVYSVFDTRRWVPCTFAPSERSVFEISASIEGARDLVMIGPGGAIVEPGAAAASSAHYPAYLAGFVLAPLRVVHAEVRSGLDVCIAHERTTPADAIARARDVLPKMLRFFEERAGLAYPEKAYATAFVPGNPMQEYAGFSALPAGYAWDLAADPREDWLLAHELSHSFWGNLVTCRTWADFWLNEALATFMTAVWKEHAFGPAEYERELAIAERRVQALLKADKAKPLCLTEGASVEDASGSLGYSEGLLVLDELRRAAGDAAFFERLATFTKSFAASAGATTSDLFVALAGSTDAPRFTERAKQRPAPRVPPDARPSAELAAVALRDDAGDRPRFHALAELARRCAPGAASSPCEDVATRIRPLAASPGRLLSTAARRVLGASRAAFFERARRGANVSSAASLASARAAGAELVRLTPENPTGRDFLVGDPASYTALVPEDLTALVATLDAAHAVELPILVSTFALPGAPSRGDARLFHDEALHERAAAFWQDLARAIGQHPAVAAFDLLNAPHPEASARIFDATDPRLAEWRAAARDTAADVNRLYTRLVAAIRAVDPVTPIVVSSSLAASPSAFTELEPVDDDAILYAFDMFEPRLFTSRDNRGLYKYPGPIPRDADRTGDTDVWDRSALRAALEPVAEFARKHKLPPARMFCGAVGCSRESPGAAVWLDDALSILDELGFGWAYSPVREQEPAKPSKPSKPAKPSKNAPELWPVVEKHLHR